MKGKQTGQPRQESEGQYHLYVFRLCALLCATTQIFFVGLAGKKITNISSIQEVLQ
jgi:hypothetical protein